MRNAYVLLVIAALILIAVAIAAYVLSLPKANEFQVVGSFANAYQPSLSLGLLRLYMTRSISANGAQSSCRYDEYGRNYDQYNLPVMSPPPINFSKFNQTLPFEFYFGAYVINSSDSSYIGRAFNSSSGFFCSYDLALVLKNSAHETYTLQVGAATARVYLFTNFTDRGLVLTKKEYVGERPNLYWYRTTTLYKNIVLFSGFWGSVPYQNLTLFNSLAEQYMSDFIANYSLAG